jgi:tRNA pseudouridine32 synthase/23S rRNA pseudouridine746 synthase
MLSRPPDPIQYTPPMEPYLQVLHSDADILVLEKPSGLLSVPGKAKIHGDCLERRAQERFADATTVHRLDMDTSGVMVMAMNRKAHRHLGLQFEKRMMRKRYIARVWGHVTGDKGVINLPLICDWPNRPVQMVDHERGKPAQTNWSVIDRETGATRMQLIPRTGRSHQLRVHMLALGHPVLGDALYAHRDAKTAADRLQLHAAELTFFHPQGGRTCSFSAECPF